MQKRYLIDSTKKLITAMQRLHSLKYKILFVVDKNQKLIGTVTDGDLRRGLIKFKDTNTEIEKVMHKKPLFSYKMKIDKETKINAEKQKLNLIPVVSKTKKLLNFVVLKKYSLKINQFPILILAGGKGKRLLPLTINTPKPMLKVNGVPIIESIIEKFIYNGFEDFYIAVNYKKEKIVNYFKKKKIGANIIYLKETKPLDTAGCLGLLPKNENRPILVINGDVITNLNPSLLIDFHLKNKNDITICVEKYVHKIPYGVINERGKNFLMIEEKPEINYFVNAGVYIIGRNIYKNIKKKQRVSMVNLINRLSKNQKLKIQSFPLFDNIIDLGNIENYKKYKSKN